MKRVYQNKTYRQELLQQAAKDFLLKHGKQKSKQKNVQKYVLRSKQNRV